jgi:hypothetical protein
LCDVALSDTRRAEHDRIAALAHEATGRQVVDLLLLDRAVEVEIKILQRLGLAEPRRFDVPLDLSLVAHGQLVVQHQFQELGVTQSIGGCLLQAHVE